MHKAKWFTWEGNSLLRVWIDGMNMNSTLPRTM